MQLLIVISNLHLVAVSVVAPRAETLSRAYKAFAPLAQKAWEVLRGEDEALLEWSTGAVIAGVILEIFELLHELQEKTPITRFRYPETPRWIKIAGAFGWLLIVVGVLGELWFEGQVSTTSEELESISNALLADASRQALSATLEAGDAAINASKALVDASTASAQSKDATTAADLANVKANTSGREALLAASDAEGAEAQAKTAQQAVDAIDAKRAALERSLLNMAICTAPRVISDWYMPPKTYVDALRRFKGYEATLIHIEPDPEARRAANNIERALNEAGWRVVTQAVDDPKTTIRDGVLVESYAPMPSPQRSGEVQQEAVENSKEAAIEVVNFLHSYNWQARYPVGPSAKLPSASAIPLGIRISVGLYPAVEFVSPPATVAIDVAETTMNKRLDALAKEEKKLRLEARLKNLPPQAAIAERQAEERWEARVEAEVDDFKLHSGYLQPCQPMNAAPER